MIGSDSGNITMSNEIIRNLMDLFTKGEGYYNVVVVVVMIIMRNSGSQSRGGGKRNYFDWRKKSKEVQAISPLPFFVLKQKLILSAMSPKGSWTFDS